jgi:hypothetical protein
LCARLRFLVAAEAVVADNQAMSGLGGLAVQEIQILIIIILTTMAGVRITVAVIAVGIMAAAETAVVVEDIIDFVMSRLPNKSPEPTAVGAEQ